MTRWRWTAVAMLAITLGACGDDKGVDAIAGPATFTPNRVARSEACTAEECSMTASIDDDLTATVWFTGQVAHGNASMRFLGNYYKITMKLTSGGQTSEGINEEYVPIIPMPDFQEVNTELNVNASCGASAVGRADYRAEIRTIASGLVTTFAVRSKDVPKVSQPECDAVVHGSTTGPAGDSGGGGGSDGREDKGEDRYRACYWTDYFINGVFDHRQDDGCFYF